MSKKIVSGMSKAWASSGQTPLFGGAADDFDAIPSPKSAKAKKGYTTGYAKCYDTHPVLELGGGKVIGGSCIYPTTQDADAYIGLDSGMSVVPTEPWEGDTLPQVYYKIVDHAAPKDAESFQKMINWIESLLIMGQTVHIGCIGGHGRTGTVLAALYAQINGDKDAISTVRKLYCDKAVESKAQVDFLHKYYGINKIAPSKNDLWDKPKSGGTLGDWWNKAPKTGSKELKSKPAVTPWAGAQEEYRHVACKGSIWGKIL